MTEILIFATILAPIITALVEVVKKAVNIPNNWIPILALLVGLIVGWTSFPFSDLELTIRLWAGAIAGLAATGLFELVKPREGESKDGVK